MNLGWIRYPLLLVAALSRPFLACAADVPLQDFGLATAKGHADSYTLDYDAGILTLRGDVSLEYADTSVVADLVTMDIETKAVSATGDVKVNRWEGDTEQVLTGRNFSYQYDERTGQLDDARVEYPPLIFLGQTIRLTEKGLIVSDATFTGCDRPHPHYRLTTDRIEIFPGDKAATRRASVWIGNRRLLTIPDFETSLKKGKRKERRSLLPKTLVNGTDLLLLQTKRKLGMFSEASPRRAQLDLGLSAKQGFRGGFELSHRTPRLNAMFSVTRKSAGADVLNSKVMLSRFPELRADLTPYPLLGGRILGDAQFSVGNLREFPSNARSDRLHGLLGLSSSVDLPSRGLAVGGRTYYRRSYYGGGRTYSVLGLDTWVRGGFGKVRDAELGYFTHNIHGSTPFEFDDIDIGRELRLSGDWYVSRKWRVPFRLRYDMDTGTWGNREVGLVKQGHCLEYGFTWDQARSELGIEFGFLGL